MGSNLEYLQAAIAGQAAEFVQKPENLLLAIVYNNPEAVSDNLQSIMGVSYAQDAEQIMNWFEEYGAEMDVDTLYDVLNVPFNPDAQNVTADYWQVLQYQAAAEYGDTVNDPLRPWAETFPLAIENLYNKYFEGQQATRNIGSDIDQTIEEKTAEKENATRRNNRRRRHWKTAAMILNIIVALSFLAFIIAGIVMLSKTEKP
ncbi:hypothetical protein [Flavihumibacter sp. CACIAM 22H1]|uniref:hypothetical protein n=1 Tax=Flavihumibacter sp. CACIAM 22H1 TaxID=1812911 RepID=UPI0007A8AFE7|nr:hypothetical protein [Flavihumibacter sp. CACIAM 22H1]KYP13041.1 MAG: hypothetical protein A1D16_04875 [Flavihumibacter sp. CACIAM 22H1]